PSGSPPAPTEPGPDAVSRGNLSDLRGSVSGPARLAYDPQSLGVAGQFVSIRVENTGSRVLPLAQLHASFATTREGVAFPCNTHVRGSAGALEPIQLRPAQSATFERLLDCRMPLPGHYEVRVGIHTADRDSEDGGSPGAG